jgi:hypothetical protein
MLKGLQARCELAMARVMEGIDFERASQHAFEAHLLAQGTGYHGFDADEPMPAFFVGEPDLIAAWESGAEMAWQFAETSACPHCKDKSIDLCPVHH